MSLDQFSSYMGQLPSLTDARIQSLIERVRMLVGKDDPRLNRLIVGFENSDRQVFWALAEALQEINEWLPFTRYELLSFQATNLIVLGAAYYLMLANSILMARNALDYSDGGIQVGSEDKYTFYANMANKFQALFDERKRLLKISHNISRGFGGGLHSDYLYLQSYWVS